MRASSIMLRPLAIVPPLAPPFIAFTRSATEVHGTPNSARACCWVNHTPRSDGIESNPQACTIRAPLASASAWWASIIARIQCGSPVRSQ